MINSKQRDTHTHINYIYTSLFSVYINMLHHVQEGGGRMTMDLTSPLVK
jgi:hypothetical protein